jgi:hypothetical protein
VALLVVVAVLVVLPASPASAAPPSNDTFNSAEILFAGSGTVDGTTVDATAQANEPNHAGLSTPNMRSVWYAYTAPATGVLTVDTCTAASFDTTLGIYTGSAVGALTQVAASDDESGCPASRSRATANVTAGTTYTFAVAGFQGASGTFTLTWSFVSPPANDAFGSAQSITGTSGTQNGTTVLATRESGEPNPFPFVDKGSAWYGWTAPASGTVTFDTCAAASYDTTLAAYTGAAVNALTTVTSNDDSNTCGTGSTRSHISFAATGGTTYRIAVAGFTEGGGTFTLTWNQTVPPPANDAFASAQTITGATGTVNGATVGATLQTGEPNHAGQTGPSGRSVWYSYTPSATGALTVDTCTGTGTGFDSLIGVYTGAAVDGLTERASDDDGCGNNATVSVPVISGTAYRIAVAGYQGDAGTFTLSWSLAPSPANDDLANAQTISGATGSANGTTVAATLEGSEPSHFGFTGTRSVWYSYTPSASGTLTLDTCTTATDTGIAVYTGTPNSGSSPIASNDDNGGCPSDNVPARVSFAVTSGTAYRIAVVTFFTGPDGGSFALAWNLVPSGPMPPANDAFASAQTISGTTGTVNGTTVGATLQTGEPNHAGETGTNGRSVWYSYTPATNGTLTVDTCTATGFDSIIGVYTGTTVNALTQRASGDEDCGDSDARATLAVTGGTTYRIAVAGYQGDAGTFTLTWSLGPANDLLASAQQLTGSTGTVNGTTVRSTFEAGEPTPFDYDGLGPSVWYQWTAPAAGDVNFETCSAATFDTMLAAYTGTEVDALTKRAEGDDDCATLRSEITFAATAGTTYRIQVTGGNGSTGTFTLAWDLDTGGPGGPTFTDVATNHPFYADIEWMAVEEISTGYQPGPTYRPSAAVTRAAMSAFMYRLAGSPAFTAPGTPTFGDVAAGHPFFEEIEWMAAEDITTGTAASPKPLYKPADAVSRGAMSAFMYRLAGEPTFTAPGSPTFGDVATGHPFYDEIEWMAAEDITTGTAASPKPLYKPANAVSRGAMSAFMHRLADGPGVDLG